MHFTGYVFSDDPEALMDSLIHRNGDPPADVLLPLEVATQDSRSGWITVQPEDWQRQVPAPYAVDDWVDCVWPTAFLRERLGPRVLLRDGALAAAGVARGNVGTMDDEWFAAVPRFFGTIGDHWSFILSAERGALVTLLGEKVWTTTVRDLDLEASLDRCVPDLVVGPDGPVFYDMDFELDSPSALRARVLAAAAPLMDLPPETEVWIVDWHG